MKTKVMSILAVVALTGAAFACSSSSSNGGGASQCASSFGPMGGSTNSACDSCTQSNCGSQESAVESGCSDYLSCICPNGMLNASLAQQCQPKEQESSCSSAVSNIESCVSAHCSSQCNSASGSSSGGTSSSSSGSGSGSGSGSSSGGGTGTTKVSCDMTAMGNCTITSVPSSEVSTFQQSCTSNGGTPGTTCPTADLEGCCTVSGAEACYYGEAGVTSSACMSAGGTWSTTP